MSPTSARVRFLTALLSQVGAPYGWGSKGELVANGQERVPGVPLRRFDCSGLVTWAFREAGGPDWRATKNTDGLLFDCLPTSEPAPGTLVLYGPRAGDASHVMVCLGAGLVVGASGGDSTTRALADAVRQDARVRVLPTVHYRRDLLCYRELPFPDE